MVPINGITAVILSILAFSVIQAENNVPVYMWNIDTDAVVNPLQTISTDDLIGKLSPSLDQKLIAVFMQDELSVEDFKSGDLAEVRSLANMDNDGTFYAPSIRNPSNLPASLNAAGYKLVNVKSHRDLPTSLVTEKTVLVVELPATQLGASRSENLQLNSGAIREVYEALKATEPDVVGILTAKKNSQLQLDESRRRITRQVKVTTLNSTSSFQFYNMSNLVYLNFENAPMLRIKDEVNNKWGNFSLNTTATYILDAANDTLALAPVTVTLTYPGQPDSTGGDASLDNADLKLGFNLWNGYWVLKSVNITFKATVGQTKFDETDFPLTPYDITTPYGFCYHCSPKLSLATGMKVSADSNKNVTSRIFFETNGFQLQPYKIKNWQFGNWYDCQGFFTAGIWAAILIGLVLAMMLAWAISMLADVKAPDRFDDPKGKTITVTATD